MKKTIILVPLFILIIALRIIFDASGKLIYLIAAINWIALLIIIACILDRILFGIKEAFSVKPKARAKKLLAKTQSAYIIITIVMFLLLMGIYFKFLCCNLGNDILSIISIGFSLLDEEIAKFVISKYEDGNT